MKMAMPAIEGIIERRVLVNFRIDPDRVASVLPAPLRAQRVGGYAIGGICLDPTQKDPPAGVARLGRVAFRERGAPDRRRVGR